VLHFFLFPFPFHPRANGTTVAQQRYVRKYLGLFKQTFKEFGEDKATRLGAALAYYTVFSIAPLLLIAMAVAGLAFGREAAHKEISGQLGGLLGREAATGIEAMLKAADKPKTGTLATIIGIVTLVFGASGVFMQLKDALNTIWNVTTKKAGGVLGFIKTRFLSIAMVLGTGFLLLVSLVFDAMISAMGGYLNRRFPGGETLLQSVQLLISFALVTVLFAAIFRFLPDTHPEWRDVWLGALFTAVLFVLGKFGLSFYLGKAAFGSTYGAAGSLVILLVWVYWSAQILFFGAEFTQVYARTHGSMAGDTSKKEARAQADQPENRPKAAEPTTLMPVYAKQKSGGGVAKLAAGGVAGLFLGAVVGGVSTFVVLLKAAKKILFPLR
jgi:membrane protein